MKKISARMTKQPLAVLVLIAVLVGAGSGVGYAATRHPALQSRATAQPAALVWHNLHLLNGATSSGSSNHAIAKNPGNPQYAVSSQGVVYLAGGIVGPSNSSLPAFNLPVGARPGFYDCFTIYSFDSSYNQQVGALHIYANGDGEFDGAGASVFDSLAGVSFVKGH
jgi:hypothetical protein